MITHVLGGPRLYYLHPLLAGPLAGWGRHAERIAALGFSHVLVAPPFPSAPLGSIRLSADHDELHPALDWPGDAASGLSEMSRLLGAAGLTLMIDVDLDRVALGGALAAAGGPFMIADAPLDPRRFDPDGDAALADLEAGALPALAAFWSETLAVWAGCGVAGFRLTRMERIPPALIAAIARAIAPSGAKLYGWMPGVPASALTGFAGCGLAGVFSSMPWWNGRQDWYWREYDALRRIAPVIAAAEAPFGQRLTPQDLAAGLARAALLSPGWMMVMGSEFGATAALDPRRDAAEAFADLAAAGTDFAPPIAALNAARVAMPALAAPSAPRLLSGAGADVLVAARSVAADTRIAGDVAVVAINLGAEHVADPMGAACAGLGGYHPLDLPAGQDLAPGGYAVAALRYQSPDGLGSADLSGAARQAAGAPRIAIEAVTPAVDGAMFPARFCVGETVAVEADIICDGHDVMAAELCWREPGMTADDWHRLPMRPLGNDRWGGAFPLKRIGPHRFTVKAWKDVFATYRDELSKKVAAGLDVTLEVAEGRLLIAAAIARADAHQPRLQALEDELAGSAHDARVTLLLSAPTAALMRAADPYAFATWVDPLPIQAERTAARFASWYEIFPRSMSGDETRHGTFDDVITHLPRIAAMGFDVLYFPPIHPIGKVNRKGRNNTLVAGPDDPGSPYGIADHTAIHPELGTFADFARLRDAAAAEGLELALDFAIQCAPDHPWLRDHQGWFDWRPDGSIRYAENPPKKYQDIVNVDFYKPDAIDGLWRELCEVVLFWCAQGVRIFRVDNPHTKPLPFWQWMIGEVCARHPDTLFLAEAFTKPKMMNRLAKVGFSQSYTYFTWRESKREFTEYMTELTTTAPKDFFRPNFFVNTPDINPVFLQTSGRAGHLIRAALAATLSGLWGVYAGFDLCEATPLPGREEYLDSEKYQIRVWDWQRPGNIVAEITRLNWIRRLNPALQTHLGITFLQAGNENILYFEKATPNRSNVVLVAINLDPVQTQETLFDAPLWRWNLPDAASLEVSDLIFETDYVWHGKTQHVRLDPNANPYAIWRVRPA